MDIMARCYGLNGSDNNGVVWERRATCINFFYPFLYRSFVPSWPVRGNHTALMLINTTLIYTPQQPVKFGLLRISFKQKLVVCSPTCYLPAGGLSA
jgi:hypothetical protein